MTGLCSLGLSYSSALSCLRHNRQLAHKPQSSLVRRFSKGLTGLICLLVLLSLCGCAERTFKKSALLLGTEVEITVFAKNPKKARRVIDLALEKIRAEERNLSYFSAESELSKINKQAGKGWVKVSPELLSLIKTSLCYSQLTDGAFNIAISPLESLYRCAKRENRVPSQKEKRKAISLCNYKKIAINEKRKMVRLSQKEMALDLGGIAKGYIVDETVKLLQKEGIKNGMVNAGGDLKVFGEKSYRIAIRNPFKVGVGVIRPETTDLINQAPTMSKTPLAQNDNGMVFKVIKVENKAVCTSGGYERPGHILNSETGEPAAAGLPSDMLCSVTIIASTATAADALATAIIVMGREKGERLLKRLGLSYFLIDPKGNITTNMSF
ncbi:MAG: FAD:protein FMN transferase [Candidatus Omnitrophica bacterium]|nr:FAD:protein FMN transferase [Candidatus Omnitrophota bacterium]